MTPGNWNGPGAEQCDEVSMAIDTCSAWAPISMYKDSIQQYGFTETQQAQTTVFIFKNGWTLFFLFLGGGAGALTIVNDNTR